MNHLRTIFGLTFSIVLTACNSVPISIGATATPSATNTPISSPTTTATTTTTPTPPITPLTRIQSGELALFYGDYETARREFETAYRDGSNSQVQAAALWGLSRTEYANGRNAKALTSLRQIITEFPDSAFIPYASFLLGKISYQLERYQEAADNFRVYLDQRPGVLDAYVQEMRGDALFDSGNFVEALEAYNAALSAPQIGESFYLEIKIAGTRSEIGDYATAISTYEDIFSRTENDYIKAQVEYLNGRALQEIDQVELANEKFQHAIENYPLSYYAYLSLVALLDAGAPVNDLNRGLVDYFAGQYPEALVALDRYINAGLDTDGTGSYYLALTNRELDNYIKAIQGFSDFIANYPEHQRWAEAWSEKAYTQWYFTGDYQNGAQTYLDFVNTSPTRPEAVDYLMSAARLYERNNRLEEATQVWQRVADEYPDSSQTSQALFLAGIAQYRRGDYYVALPIFQRSLLLSTEKEDQARAYLWVGKTQQQLGDEAAKQVAWQQAQSADPTGYYSERARELLIGREPFGEPSSYDIDIDLEAERSDAEAWVRLTFGLPAETDLKGLGSLAGDIRIVRGTEFWELGMYEEARLEFEDLRENISINPENSFRLTNYLLDLGLYRSAIFASRQVLTLAGLDEHASSLSAPAYFNHIRYGTYYSDLIVPNAEAKGFHPLLMFSIIRQESLFEGFVRSNAGARGLMQIIPSTGESIANTIGWPAPFHEDDLYRPNVSVRYGAHYLASNRDLLDNDLYATLAAYNAGPGNATVWKDLSGDDPDLYLEVVRYQETSNYIRYIYEIYEIYQRLYSPMN